MMAIDQATSDRQGSRPGEVGEIRSADYFDPRERHVFLEIRVPVADADVSIGGEKMTEKGTVRLYRSPPITPGRTYTYEIYAKWMENGREVTRTRILEVQAGFDFNMAIWMDSLGRKTRTLFAFRGRCQMINALGLPGIVVKIIIK